MAVKQVQAVNTSLVAQNFAQDETIVLLRKIVKLLESNAVVDTTQQQRVSANQLTAANLNATVVQGTAASLQTTATISGTPSVNSTAVATTVNMGQVVIGYGGQATAAANIVDSRYTLIDQARNAYANGIRSKLTFGANQAG